MADEALKIVRGLADDAVAADSAQPCWLSFEHGDLPAALAQIDEAVGSPGSQRSPADCLYSQPSCGVRERSGRSGMPPR